MLPTSTWLTCLLLSVTVRYCLLQVDASDFNLARNFSARTKQALDAQKAVMDHLGKMESWLGETGEPHEVAARMMKVVSLQALRGEHDDAIRLLKQAVIRATHGALPHTVHLPLGALLSPCTVCGAGTSTRSRTW